MQQRINILYVVMLLLSAYTATAEKIRQFHIRENDTTAYTLNLVLDDNGMPLYFFRNIFTPVCLTGECRPVYINFYWDLLGNYTKFDLPPGEVLTKADHREFTPEDYDKLREILARPNSILKDLRMEELVAPGTENLRDSVDGVTAATPKAIRNEVIAGAVYTCYTLWHLAHGPVTNEILRITESYKSEQLLHRFLRDPNYHYQYWAMDRVMDSSGHIEDPFKADILGIIRGGNIFAARYALQKMNSRYFEDDGMQQWIWDTYLKSVYPLQLVILKKLKDVRIGHALADSLAGRLAGANREQQALIQPLLDKHRPKK